YETEDFIFTIRLWVSSKNHESAYEMIQVSTAYTYKGDRDQPGVLINGELIAMKIEIQEVTYTTYHEMTWQTADTARQCWPRDFDANGETASWSTVGKIGTAAVVSTMIYLSPLTGGSSALAGLAIGTFITIMRDSVSHIGDSMVDNTGLSSDPIGAYYWISEMPCGMEHYYGGAIGYQHAWDFESHNQIRHGWTSSAKGKTLQLRFRVKAVVQDLSTPSDEVVEYTPWTNLYSVIEDDGPTRPPGSIIR
ncbi:MAG: hypothetical protein RTU92_02415, partial [Candidatus Thorarchaeota archaeon]